MVIRREDIRNEVDADSVMRVLLRRQLAVADEEIEVQASFAEGRPYEGYSPVRIRRGDAEGGATIRFPRCVGDGAVIEGFVVDGKLIPIDAFRVDVGESPGVVLRGDSEAPKTFPVAMMNGILDAVNDSRARLPGVTDFQVKVAVLGAALMIVDPALDRRRIEDLIDLALGVFGLVSLKVRPDLPEPFEADPEDE